MKQQLGPYQLVERLGVGGMAEVFLANARREGDFVQPCVVKILHDKLARDRNFTRMLLEEARLIAGLRHNNIASLYDVGRQEGKFFMVMEYVQGKDLHHILAKSVRRQRPLPIEFALHVGRQLCSGLHFAHTRRGADGEPLQLVHRDISPPNVLVSTVGEVKLIDFGVAKFSSELREKTRTGVIKGKFGYMSPEQAWDEPLDARSDLFAVGICLYEMLTGRSLYGQSDDALTMLKRAREADIDPISRWREDVPEELAEVVHRALKRRREDRFQTAHELERNLTALLARIAPDYTGLDAGELISELFGTDDPAIDDKSPRLGGGHRAADEEVTKKARRPPRPVAKRTVDESTQPMKNVPDDVRASGGYLRPSAEEIGGQTDGVADEATVNLTFPEDADFSDEATELFDEQRISGAHPTIDRSAASSPGPGPANPSTRPSTAPKKSRHGRDPSRQTRQIADELQEAETDPRRSTPQAMRLDEEATDPRRDAPPIHVGSGRQPLRQPDERSAPDDGTSDIEGLSWDGQPEIEPRPDVLGTSPVPVVDRDQVPAGKPNATVEEVDHKASILARIDRRLQIGAAAVFVLFALMVVVLRFL